MQKKELSGSIMKRVLMLAIAFFLTHQTMQAVDISVVAEGTADHPAIILVKGIFTKEGVKDDIGLFSALAADQKGTWTQAANLCSPAR
jgi:hypothetical protein